jgi:hypothetical protein
MHNKVQEYQNILLTIIYIGDMIQSYNHKRKKKRTQTKIMGESGYRIFAYSFGVIHGIIMV